MILVVGATGLLGGEICACLRAAGRPVRALVRPTSSPERVRRLLDLGAELATGDLKDRASLDTACRGVDAVVSTASTLLSRQPDDSIPRTDQIGQQELVDAAEAARVGHFVYTSVSPNLRLDSPLLSAKHSVEAHLRNSGLAYSILRASCFMEVWLSPRAGFDHEGGRVRLPGSGTNPVSYVSVRDLARFAAGCLDAPAARGAVLDVGGPEPVSPLAAVRIFEQVSGRAFAREHVPEALLRAQYEAARDPLERSLAGLMLEIAGGDALDVTPALRRIPLQLTGVREYAQRVAGAPRRPEVPEAAAR